MNLNSELQLLLNRSILNDEATDLIGLGSDPNVLSDSGYSLLHLLIFNKRVDEAVRLVVTYKADINVKDKKGCPPLYYMLNDKFSPDQLMKMIRAGANPNVQNQAGKAPLHYLITGGATFELIRELLEKNAQSINFKSREGTPLELMLNATRGQSFKAEDYINMVRLGADIDSQDNHGNSLLSVIIKIGRKQQAKELVVLSKIAPKERLMFKPTLSDYFVREDGIQSLLDDLLNNEVAHEDIERLGKYPHAKELVLKYIKYLGPERSEKFLDSALSPRTSLNCFFSVPRGWFMTHISRGTLAQLVETQKEFKTQKLSHTECSRTELSAKPYPS